VLQVGDDVELRLLPGGGTSAADALAALEKAQQLLAAGLKPYGLASVEEVATAERRLNDLLAEERNLQEQLRSGGDAAKVSQRLNSIRLELDALPADPADDDTAGGVVLEGEALQARLSELEQDLRQARQGRDQAIAAEQSQRQVLQQSNTALEGQRQAIETAERELRQQENQLLEARTRVEALLERHGSLEALEAALGGLDQRVLEPKPPSRRCRLN
jgi:chromosome segregation ATPase